MHCWALIFLTVCAQTVKVTDIRVHLGDKHLCELFTDVLGQKGQESMKDGRKTARKRERR